MRLLLSELRGGDYAHPGDEEAIDLVLKKIYILNPQAKSGTVLDVGCGFGGTLQYLKQQGFKKLYGIDINEDSILYAKKKYSDIQFEVLDALNVDAFFLKKTFDLIILFNSIYAIQDKSKLLQVLGNIANPGAVLVVFDYSIPNPQEMLAVYDFAGKEMEPINLPQFLNDLNAAGWKFQGQADLSQQFIIWYNVFLTNLRHRRDALLNQYSKEDIKKVENTFSYFLSRLESKDMGGVVIYAQKK